MLNVDKPMSTLVTFIFDNKFQKYKKSPLYKETFFVIYMSVVIISLLRK